jgi:hypothetical protein
VFVACPPFFKKKMAWACTCNAPHCNKGACHTLHCTEWYNERHEVVLGVTESLIPPEHSPNAYVKLKDALAAMDAWDFTGTLSPERKKK